MEELAQKSLDGWTEQRSAEVQEEPVMWCAEQSTVRLSERMASEPRALSDTSTDALGEYEIGGQPKTLRGHVWVRVCRATGSSLDE